MKLTKKLAVVTLYSYFPARFDHTMSIAWELVRIVSAHVTTPLIQHKIFKELDFSKTKIEQRNKKTYFRFQLIRSLDPTPRVAIAMLLEATAKIEAPMSTLNEQNRSGNLIKEYLTGMRFSFHTLDISTDVMIVLKKVGTKLSIKESPKS